MSRQFVVPAAIIVVLTALATPSNADAEEPARGYFATWGDWWEDLDLLGRKSNPPLFRRVPSAGFVYQGSGPRMPVDYSFDELVESDRPWPTSSER